MSRRTDAPARSPRRAALASWIGSALEYYDFAVYGTAAAIRPDAHALPDGLCHLRNRLPADLQ